MKELQSEQAKKRKSVVARSMLGADSRKLLLEKVEKFDPSLLSKRKTLLLKNFSKVLIKAICQPGGREVRDAIVECLKGEHERVVNFVAKKALKNHKKGYLVSGKNFDVLKLLVVWFHGLK